MTEITDLSPTDAANTSISTESLEGNVANMGRMEETLQAVMGLLARSIRTNVLRFLDHTDDTKKLALDLSGLTTATERTLTVPDYDGTMASHALGTAIASAATTDIGAASGSTVHVTGTTTITALGTADAGIEKTVIFDGALVLTHNATSLILPNLANITTVAGDAARFVSEGSGNWRCVGYSSLPPWRLSYDSGEQTITSGGFITLAHGLGARPTLVHAILRCKTAEHDYEVGDEIDAQTFENGDRGVILERKPSTIVVLYGTQTSVFTAKNTSTRGGVFLTNANWRLIVRAYI